MVTNQTFIFNNNPIPKEQKLRNQITTPLKAPQIRVKKEQKADIQFALNAEREIVVPTLDSKNYVLEDFVKSRLNYKKVTLDTLVNRNEISQITLKI